MCKYLQVSNIYGDATIGNSIKIAVVEILLLKDDLVESHHVYGLYSFLYKFVVLN